MSEPARPLGLPEASEDPSSPGLLRKIKQWLSPQNTEGETVRDVIEELIEERNEESPGTAAGIDPNERLLLANVLKLRGVTVADIMVPRADITAMSAETSIADVLRLMAKGGHSRLPVFRDSLDDVIGLVHIKDLAVLATEAGDVKYEGAEDAASAPKLTDLVRPVLFASPTARVLDLLLEMRLKRMHMAMVVDEYGGIDGLVTIEDVVEQIVGEIEDEHDSDDTPQMIEHPDGSLTADARVTIGAFEARYGDVFTDEEEEQTETLGGLVYFLSGRVPRRSELVRHSSGIEFQILDGDPRRVRRLRIRNLPAPKPAEKAD